MRTGRGLENALLCYHQLLEGSMRRLGIERDIRINQEGCELLQAIHQGFLTAACIVRPKFGVR